MSRIIIFTDAWHPQVNGVVVTLEKTISELQKDGHIVKVIDPCTNFNLPCPTYPEIKLTFLSSNKIKKILKHFNPDYIHIATEGPIGISARRFLNKNNYHYTTSYHTKFPEFISSRFPINSSWGYKYMRWFHKKSSGMMVSTESLKNDLEKREFNIISMWTRGVDFVLFSPQKKIDLKQFKKPIHLYVGRVSIEKGIKFFLDLDLIGSKIIIGDGPQLEELKTQYKDTHFLGYKFGNELAEYYASSDVFVFPSVTDTFGLVILEALASGTPVAAFPVTGPKDIITSQSVGFLSNNLKESIEKCYSLNGEKIREFSKKYSWSKAATIFYNNLRHINNNFSDKDSSVEKTFELAG